MDQKLQGCRGKWDDEANNKRPIGRSRHHKEGFRSFQLLHRRRACFSLEGAISTTQPSKQCGWISSFEDKHGLALAAPSWTEGGRETAKGQGSRASGRERRLEGNKGVTAQQLM